MRVQADDHRVTVWNVAAEIFDLIGIDIRRCRLDRGGQVEDDRLFGCGGQYVHHCAAYFKAEIEFSRAECFGRIFKMPVGIWLSRRIIAQQFRAQNCDIFYLRLSHFEHNVTPCGANCVIQMDNSGPRPAQAFETRVDQVFARLGEHLNHNIVWNFARLHKARNKIKLGCARAGKANLYFFHAHLEQQIEKTLFFLCAHRVDQGLIAIAQVSG